METPTINVEYNAQNHDLNIQPKSSAKDSTFLEELLNQTEKEEQHSNETKEKAPTENLVEGVTYNPQTKKYTLKINDYGLRKMELDRYHLTLIDNSTTIESDVPITKEYLKERYEKIQHFF